MDTHSTKVSKTLLTFIGYNGRSRFWNEFTQLLDPHYTTIVGDHYYWLKTGHGRLFWRARTILTEEPYIIEWIQSMGENDVFYDIGANVGIYTLLGATHADHTYAFEPVFQNLSVLEENIVRNNLEDMVTIVPIALDKTQRVVKIKHRSLGASEANQLFDVRSDGTFNYEVNRKELSRDDIRYQLRHLTQSADELQKAYKLRMPTYLKVDVDGCEDEVFQGLSAILSEGTIKTIYYEENSNNQRYIYERYLRQLGFKIDHIVPVGNQLSSSTNIIVSR